MKKNNNYVTWDQVVEIFTGFFIVGGLIFFGSVLYHEGFLNGEMKGVSESTPYQTSSSFTVHI